MNLSHADQTFERLVQKLDPCNKLLRAWALQGGVSAQVTALEIAQADGTTQKLVVRQHGAVDLHNNAQIAADEFRLLQLLHAKGVAVPAPYYLDQSGELFPTPVLVIEYIDGQTDFAPQQAAERIPQLAAQLSRLHKLNCAELDCSFLPQQEQLYTRKLHARPATLDASLDEGRIRDALELAWPLPQRNRSVVLHGDYWPGNILWRAGQLVGVIDWEDAALGDPLADLANSRLELLWALGTQAMQHFTDAYRSLTKIDWTNLPYWDLCAALRPAGKLGTWGLDAASEQRMLAGHRCFVDQAFDKLSTDSAD